MEAAPTTARDQPRPRGAGVRDGAARVPPQRGDARGSGAALPGSAVHGAAIGSICSPKKTETASPSSSPSPETARPLPAPRRGWDGARSVGEPRAGARGFTRHGGIYPGCGDLPRVPGWLPGPRAWDLQHSGSKWKWGQAARAPPGLRDKSPSPAAGEAGPCPTASLPMQEVLRFILCLC